MQPNSSTPALVESGNDVAVHSGQAHLQLAGGGEISICGPAKFTVLESGGEITLALEFGRMHVDLPASVQLRVLTPSIVATPIDIQGGKRDLIVGLDQNDSLCVLAATGAVQLEQEFSGERLIVPESSDFSLEGGKLIPTAQKSGSCQCAALPQGPGSSYAPTETAIVVAPDSDSAASPAPAQPSPAQQPDTMSPVVVETLAAPNQNHPAAAPDKSQSPAPPPDSSQVYKIILPPMSFSSSSATPPDVPSEETALLIREIHADPDWEFTGRVETPAFARAMSSALGEDGTNGQAANSAPAQGPAQKKHHGFWSSLKRILVGNNTGQ
jgi:hypothetical protein